ncbi:hypothetical protein C1H46_006570 [Malus baccata]|uniref:Uncharacterized protein n=1 Tax=Malus baccata TaxID=106549 RepID=A0A540N9T6_MALBA|nr:hypothetical protein C1H46_006570 [Malus baccata]
MLNLISSQRVASRVSQTPSLVGNVAATSTLDMGTTSTPQVTPLGPTVSTAPTSLTSSVTHPILSARRTHQQPSSSEEAQPSSEASSAHGKGS